MMPYMCSVKKSIKRAMWQVKDGPKHELVPMHGLQLHLDEAVAALGGDNQDPYSIWGFVYHDQELRDFSFLLGLADPNPGTTVNYRVVENRLGRETRPLWLPTSLLSVYPELPAQLWVRLEPATTDRPVYLSPYQE